MSSDRDLIMPQPQPRLFAFGLFCAVVGGFSLFMALDIPFYGEYFLFRLFGSAFLLVISAVSFIALALLLVVRPAPPAQSQNAQPDPLSFLLFAYFCVFLNNEDLLQMAEDWPDARSAATGLIESTEGAVAVGLMAAIGLVITVCILHLIHREWKRRSEDRRHFRLVCHVWALNFFGFFLAYPPLAVAIAGSDNKLQLLKVESAMSNAVAALMWAALLVLAVVGLRDSIASIRAPVHPIQPSAPTP